jgi:predicted type IV restriction endonuclease
MIEKLIILLLFIWIGIILAMIIKTNNTYRGPNSSVYKKKIIYNKIKNRCYQYLPYPITCPTEKKRYQIFYEKFINLINNSKSDM